MGELPAILAENQDSQKWLSHLMAAAAATAAASAATGGGGGFGGSSIAAAVCGGEDGKLDCGFFASALGAGDFLLLVDDNLLEAGFALFTKVFVDGHRGCSFDPLRASVASASIIAGVAAFGGPSPLFVEVRILKGLRIEILEVLLIDLPR
jgi:hypothetical protein